MTQITLIIPVYQPEAILSEVLSQCLETGLPCLLIDDGSTVGPHHVLTTLPKHPSLTVLKHQYNQGKGAALKTAFQYHLQHKSEENLGVITLDADGQHALDDILRLIQAFKANPSALHLGVRQFAQHKVPPHRKWANQLTQTIFRYLTGYAIEDTQTGLRAIPNTFLPALLTLPGDGYEFELQMLLKATESLPIHQLPIQAIYHTGNSSSHFHPIRDSYKIYRVFWDYQLK